MLDRGMLCQKGIFPLNSTFAEIARKQLFSSFYSVSPFQVIEGIFMWLGTDTLYLPTGC